MRLPRRSPNARRRGALVRLTAGVYSTDVVSPPATVVARQWPTIVVRLFPFAVVTDRSGPNWRAGVLYLAHPARERTVDLPGLTVSARSGAGPVDGDIPLPGGLHQSGKGRALAENTRPSRSRGGRMRRMLTEVELGDWVDRLGQLDGAQRLASYGTQAMEVADAIGVPERAIGLLHTMIDATPGSNRTAVSSPALRSRQVALPYDQGRMRLFEPAARRAPAVRTAEQTGSRRARPSSRPLAVLRGVLL